MDLDIDRSSPNCLERLLIDRALLGDISVVYECDIPSIALARADSKGTPLLHLLACKGKQTLEVLRVFTLRGADLSKPNENDNGYTPLHAVAKSLYLPTSALLLRSAPSTMSIVAGKEKFTPLHIAASIGATALFPQAKEALGSRAFSTLLSFRDLRGRTPLLIAAENGHVITVLWILQHGAYDAVECNIHGFNALHFAIERNDSKMITSIISTLKDIGSGIGDIDMTVSVLERYINAKNEKGMRAVDIAYQKIIKQNGLRNLSLILNWCRLRLLQALYTKSVSSLSSSSSSSSSSFDPEIGNGSTNNSLLMFSSGNTTTSPTSPIHKISPRSNSRSVSLVFFSPYKVLALFYSMLYFIINNPLEAVLVVPLSFFITLFDYSIEAIWPMSFILVTYGKHFIVIPSLLNSTIESKEERKGFLNNTFLLTFSWSLSITSFLALFFYILTRLFSRLDILGSDCDSEADIRRVDYVRALLGEESTPTSSLSTVLCHTCSIARPSRSKHCSHCGRCVAVFDHCCAWTGCCIGESNHGVYFLFVLFASIAALLWLALLVLFIFFANYKSQESIQYQWNTLFFIFLSIQPLWMLVFGVVLLISHTRMIARGLTTNEAKKWTSASYAYLRDEKGRFRNPYSQRTSRANCLNFWSRCSKSIIHYLLISIHQIVGGIRINGKGGKQG